MIYISKEEVIQMVVRNLTEQGIDIKEIAIGYHVINGEVKDFQIAVGQNDTEEREIKCLPEFVLSG